ncbi:MAG: hypothetical protein ACPG5B_04025 [Chitinophagales bacterium]
MSREKEIEKVQRKVLRWFKKNDRICSQILITFLDTQNELGFVDYDFLAQRCSHIKTFKTNFAQMVNIARKNHGKVFERTEDNRVILWKPVEKDIRKAYQEYLETKSVILLIPNEKV